MADSPTAVTLSIGAVTFESPPQSADDAVSRADRLMYEVKGAGKNDVAHQAVRESAA